MKRNILGLVAFTAMAGAIALPAQVSSPVQAPSPAPAQVAAPALTADEVVNKYLDAIGGKDAISKVKTLSVEGTMQVMGSEAPTSTVTVDGVGSKQESLFNGTKIISCYTDKGGWMVNPMAGAADPTPMPDDQYNSGKAGIYVGGLLYDYAAKGSTIELASKDDKTYTINLTTKEKVKYTFVIDAKTYLVNTMTTETSMQGQPVTLTASYSDYRKTETGFMVPYGIGLDFGQFQLSIAVKKVELNKAIDPAIFALPKAGA
ncbi:MAG: hypothetical protein ABSE46_15845 [Terracidiphilus sp.]|jgi:hypothetical protein